MANERSRVVYAEAFSSNDQQNANALMNNKFEFLFEDAKRRKTHQERVNQVVLDNECTFRPNIRLSQQQKRSSVANVSEKKTPSKSHIKRRPNPDNIDLSTGQALYKPKVGRPPKIDRNAECLPIGDYLFSDKKRKDEMLSLIKREEDERAKESAPRIEKTSNKIIEKLKIDTFTHIFNVVDNDSDGIISAKNIDVSSNI